MYQIDLTIFRWFNSWAGINNFYDWGIIFKADYLLYVMILGVFAFFVFFFFAKASKDEDKKRAKWVIIHAFFAGILARFVFKPIIVLFWDRARPFSILADVHRLVSESPAGAMPSGHAVFSFAVAMAVYFYYPKTSILFFLAAISMGLARVAAGVHWPSDILAGALVGIFSAWLINFMLKKFWK
ncbi:MAG: phosphatase PAP2 family protein [bacterium]|nr:phosphatase PAP2 family protein [bacterium]